MSTSQGHLLVVLLLLCLIGCGPSQYLLTPQGDMASVQTKSGLELDGELLCIQNSSIYVVIKKPRAKVIQLSTSDLKHLQIEGYANRRWVTSILLFQAIPTVLFTIAAASANGDPGVVFLVCSIPTALTYLLFEDSTPSPPQSTNPSTFADIQHLSKYSRFPQGLTETQFQIILKNYDQIAPERSH